MTKLYSLHLLGERTHQIPIEGLAKKEDTFRKIWLDLLRFVNPEQTAIFPPVYCRVGKSDLINNSFNIVIGNPHIIVINFCFNGLIYRFQKPSKRNTVCSIWQREQVSRCQILGYLTLCLL